MYSVFEELLLPAILKFAVLALSFFRDYQADTAELFPVRDFHRFNRLGATVSLSSFPPLPIARCFVTALLQPANLCCWCLLFLPSQPVGRKYHSRDLLAFYCHSSKVSLGKTDVWEKLSYLKPRLRAAFLLIFFVLPLDVKHIPHSREKGEDKRKRRNPILHGRPVH